eukprot:TRINITY_DN28712_c0_g1_i1.p1 TRINITY_DN28712_c0_g1~~TRINITY_DN28712_c0_g1_i1.p1  ORF type:complete len:469 (+),score=119.05 TRINITY_DN28712_c0_g1_i1:69-1409(+)
MPPPLRPRPWAAAAAVAATAAGEVRAGPPAVGLQECSGSVLLPPSPAAAWHPGRKLLYEAHLSGPSLSAALVREEGSQVRVSWRAPLAAPHQLTVHASFAVSGPAAADHCTAAHCSPQMAARGAAGTAVIRDCINNCTKLRDEACITACSARYGSSPPFVGRLSTLTVGPGRCAPVPLGCAAGLGGAADPFAAAGSAGAWVNASHAAAAQGGGGAPLAWLPRRCGPHPPTAVAEAARALRRRHGRASVAFIGDSVQREAASRFAALGAQYGVNVSYRIPADAQNASALQSLVGPSRATVAVIGFDAAGLLGRGAALEPAVQQLEQRLRLLRAACTGCLIVLRSCSALHPRRPYWRPGTQTYQGPRGWAYNHRFLAFERAVTWRVAEWRRQRLFDWRWDTLSPTLPMRAYQGDALHWMYHNSKRNWFVLEVMLRDLAAAVAAWAHRG